MRNLDIYIRELKISDLQDYLFWNHPSQEFHRFNGPYYGRDSEEELKNILRNLGFYL